MRQPTPPELVVIAVPTEGDERFPVVEGQAVMSAFVRAFTHTSTTEERLSAVADVFRAEPALTVAEARERLAARGVDDAEIDERIDRARRLLGTAASVPFVFERITRIGYCNAEGQEVIGKTDRPGPSGQRVFVMRCRVCSHEYGAYGCDADIRRCPRCQDGPPDALHRAGLRGV